MESEDGALFEEKMIFSFLQEVVNDQVQQRKPLQTFRGSKVGKNDPGQHSMCTS